MYVYLNVFVTCKQCGNMSLWTSTMVSFLVGSCHCGCLPRHQIQRVCNALTRVIHGTGSRTGCSKNLACTQCHVLISEPVFRSPHFQCIIVQFNGGVCINRRFSVARLSTHLVKLFAYLIEFGGRACIRHFAPHIQEKLGSYFEIFTCCI